MPPAALPSATRRLLLGLPLLACGPGTLRALAATPAAAAPAESAALTAALQALLDAQLAADERGGFALLVQRRGQTLLRAARGLADAGVPLRAVDAFRIGSVTKPFTAAAILLLAERGQLGLDDALGRHLPQAPERARALSLRQLLSNTSGLPDFVDHPDWAAQMQQPATLASSARFYAEQAPDFAPGTAFAYSNTGFWLLGLVIEQIARQPYAAFMARELFEPLGLRHTAFEEPLGSQRLRVVGFARREGRVEPAPPLHASQFGAAGALVSTLDDLARWNAALAERRLLGATSWELATRPAALAGGGRAPYGLGWAIGELQGWQTIEHLGGVNGFAAFVLRLAEPDVFVAVLSNAQWRGYAAMVLAHRAAGLAAGRPYPEFRAVQLDAAQLDRHVGLYRLDERNTRRITREGGHLVSQRAGGARVALTPMSATEFFVEGTLTQVRFEVDAQGRSTHMQLRQIGGSDRSVRVDD